jgi:light-regulated signal transduction histidine kinase (bacteriophytochrome)
LTSRIQATSYDVILADYNLPQWRGTEALDILCSEKLDVPLIVVTGYLGEEKAVECIKLGATDCVLKDRLARLPASVRRALEEKRLRDQRRKSERALASKVAELAYSNAELEQFAYVASHDLQEPLRMIATYTQLLAERYRGKLDEQADKYIGYSVDGALRMQALIHDLLKFSRVGKAEIEPRTTECCAVVEQAVKNLQAAIKESGAVVSWNSLPLVMADPSQLTQVFQNLLANAIKFHGSETPVIQIDVEKKDHEWVLTVSDNGIGIPAENWQDVFDIFRRLHTRTEYAGNGIGLSICKKIIERHGGKLWIEAQAKPGCRFKFTLPAEPPSKAAQEAQA